MQEDDEIVNIHGAAALLSQKYGRTITPGYIRELRRAGRLTALNEQEEGEQTKSYLFRRSDVEKIKIGAARTRKRREAETNLSGCE